MGAIIVGGIFMLISTLIGGMLKKKFAKYSKVRLGNGMSGKEIAEKMLADNSIDDVKVISVAGQLTDHYNPVNKTVNLSEVVYNQVNAAAAAVAAHECGHAVQHATAYSWLTMRSKLVPAVNISSKVMRWVILIGVAIASSTQNTTVLMIGIALFAVTTLFSFVTLPVEFDASRRALTWMTDKGVVTAEEHAGAKDALKWAAMTYVAAALGSLATLLYYITRYLGRR
ncbi:MAG: zinc metallopeptidase [Flavobacteriales bacterium]|nr:zinc metallopeptidase [Flavobacteriales bacterium]